MKWIDITDELTDKGKEELEPGQVLIFNFEGSPIHLKIMRKARGKVWAKRVRLYSHEEISDLKVVDA